MSNTAILIILGAYLGVLAVLVWIIKKYKEISTQGTNLAAAAYENNSALVDLLTSRDKRDREVAQLFAGILFDLSHATDKNVLQWKLSMLRNLDFIMNLSGYDNVYDDNFYTWMYNSLTQMPENAQIAQLQKIRDSVKGYYIMDAEVGKNFCDVIADIIKMNSDVDAVGEVYKRTFKSLLRAIQDTNIEFLVANMSRHTEGTPRDELFESLRSMRETCADAEEAVRKFDMECGTIEAKKSGEEPTEPDSSKDEISGQDDPVVQGEETAERCEEVAPSAETEIPRVEMKKDDGSRTGVEVIMGHKQPGNH